jgi:hypothetical protein
VGELCEGNRIVKNLRISRNARRGNTPEEQKCCRNMPGENTRRMCKRENATIGRKKPEGKHQAEK